MPDRTIKMIGFAFSNELYDPGISSVDINVKVMFNGSEVFNGPITVTEADNTNAVPGEICSWSCSTEVIGLVPMAIEISGPGTLEFTDLLGNYTGIQNFEIDAENRLMIGLTSTADEFGQLSPVNGEVDGKLNVVIDGISYTRDTTTGLSGPWTYTISTNGTLECDFFIDPARTVNSDTLQIGEPFKGWIDPNDPNRYFSFGPTALEQNKRIPLRISAPVGENCTGCKYLRGTNTCNFGFVPTLGDGIPVKDPICAAIPLDT